MAIYDLEALMYEVEAFLKLRLNTEISAISTEKNDGLSLATIGSNAYAVQSLDDKIMNYSEFVFIQCMDIKTVGQGPATSKDYSITALIVSASKQNQLNQVKRMFRYGRAMERVFEKYWDSTNSQKIKFKIESIPPQDYTDLNQTKSYRVAGVVLSGGLA